MPKFFLTILCIGNICLHIQGQSLKSKIDSISYAAGVAAAYDLKNKGIDNFNIKLFSTAFEDAYKGKPVVFDEQYANGIFSQHINQIWLNKNVNFLIQNAQREGVITLDSGVQYEILVPGVDEQRPTDASRVVIHYTGSLITGQEFDNSIQRGEAVSLELDGVISGLAEVLKYMTIRDKWKIYIPSEKGYGEFGVGAVIPPHSTLIFEVELLAIE